MKRLFVLLAVLVATVGVALPAVAAGPPESAGQAIPGRFIVTVRDGVDAGSVAAEYRRRDAVDVDYVYTAALNGFAGAMSDGAVARLRGDARVSRVEADGVVTTTDTVTQTNATWGLDRIDQRDLPLSGTYGYVANGSGVTAYVIDTGIRITHEDFGGRASHGWDAVDNDLSADDCNGHGTHVAGTIGGATYGVAKNAELVAVRVLNCAGSGTWSGVIAGVDWVTNNAKKPAVANMSLGGGANNSVDTAVRNSIEAGVVYSLAAGNSDKDACNYSPARVTQGLTVGSTTNTDARSSFSNTGICLDLFAPGSSITSAWKNSDTSTKTISGTSMAAPHVAGVAALYLQANATASASAVNDALVANATSGKVTSPGAGSPNLLLHSLWTTSVDLTAPAQPKNFTATATSTSTIDLGWSDVAGEDSYELARSEDGTNYTVIEGALAANTEAHEDTGLDAGKKYWYRLVATNTEGDSTPAFADATTWTTTEPSETPDAPDANFIYDCGGDATCVFDGSTSTGAELSYAWSFGATTATAEYTFTGPGSWTVDLTVTDVNGVQNTESQTLHCGWVGKGKNKTLACS